MKRIKVKNMRAQKGMLPLRLRPRLARGLGVGNAGLESVAMAASMLNYRGRPVQVRDQDIPVPPRIPGRGRLRPL